MVELRGRQIQSAVEQELAGGGFEQVFAADDFGDAHGGVIHDDGELIRGDVVVPPDDEVAEVLPGNQLLGAVTTVCERNDLPIRHLKPPVGLSR